MSATAKPVERVLVLGATGKVGSPLTRMLVAQGLQVHAYFDPDTSRSSDPLPSEVEQHHGDFGDAASLSRAMVDIQAVFLLTPPSTHQVEWQRTIIAAAQKAGVERILKLSAFDSRPDSMLRMGRWHHDGEVALVQSGIEYVIVRPQYFMQNLVPALTKALETGVFAFAAAPATRLGLIDAVDVADVVSVLIDRRGHGGTVVSPTGPEALSFADLAAQLSEVLGREILYVQQSREQGTEQLRQRGLPDWHIEDFFAVNGELASPEVNDDVERVSGHPPASFRQFLHAQLQVAETAWT